MSSDPLEGPKLKVERADTHISDVRDYIKQYFETCPYTTFTELDASGERELLKLRLTNPPPGKIAIVVGDVVHNLRSALDQLACCLAIRNGFSDASGTYFPFAVSREIYESKSVQEKVKKLPQAAVQIIHELKPYQGGNDLLWSLHQLDIIDKHRALIPIATTHLGIKAQLTAKPLGTFPHTFSIPKALQPLDKDAVILVYPAGLQFDSSEIEFTVDMAFHNVGPIEGQPVLTVLHQFVAMIKSILGIFEDRILKQS